MRPDVEGQGQIVTVALHTYECCRCTHVYQDTPGQTATSNGCPDCGSLYFRDFGVYLGPALKPVYCQRWTPLT